MTHDELLKSIDSIKGALDDSEYIFSHLAIIYRGQGNYGLMRRCYAALTDITHSIEDLTRFESEDFVEFGE